jgi:hypothetical protein
MSQGSLCFNSTLYKYANALNDAALSDLFLVPG